MSTTALPVPQAPIDLVCAGDVDREIRHGFWSLSFEPDLERVYVQQTRDAWHAYRNYAAIAGIVLFDLYIFADWRLLPDVIVEAIVLRFLIATPLMVGTIFVGRGVLSTDRLELLIAGVGVALSTVTIFLLLRSSSPYRLDYTYGNMLIILNTAVAQRLRFRFALAGTAGIVITSLVGLGLSDVIDTRLYQSDAIFFLSGATLVLFASYSLERDHRRRHIVSVRGELLDRQLELSVNVDPLTGLWNRRHLNETMQAMWTCAESAPVPMAVILLDIDFFKAFNDTYGHPKGDLCLERIGRCLRDALAGEPATLARYGGEEFLVFAQDIDEKAALAMAERLLDAIRLERIPHPTLGEGAIVTASLGVAVAPIPATSAASLIAAADQALYRAKSGGRARVALASHHGEIWPRLRTEENQDEQACRQADPDPHQRPTASRGLPERSRGAAQIDRRSISCDLG